MTEFKFTEPHGEGDGWQSAKKKKKSRKKRAAEFWTWAYSVGAPLLGGPSAFIPGFVSRQRYILFTGAQKRLFVAIVLPSRRRAAKHNGFKREEKEEKINKMRDYLFFSSAAITLVHGRGFVSLHSQISRRYEKGLRYGEEYIFVSTQMHHVPHMCIILNISLVYRNHPYCFFDCDVSLQVCYVPQLQTMKLFFFLPYEICKK